MEESNSLISSSVLDEMIEVALTTPAGSFAEFGVYKGGSAYYLMQAAKERGNPLYLYDTFTGIPFRGEFDQHNVGDFADTSYELVKELIPDAIICQGIFPESVVEMPPMAFVHIDADQYQSYLDAFDVFEPLMVKGGVMWFDDFGCLAAADKAINERYDGKVITTRTGKGRVVF